MLRIRGDKTESVAIIETPDSDYHDYLLTVSTPKRHSEIVEVDQEAYGRFYNLVDDKYLDDE